GYELGGRNLRVNEAQDRPPRAPRVPNYGGDEGRGGGWDAPKRFKPKGSRKNARARKRGF
ncbi:MAG: RNA-binding protein, partial [Gammaproteobacteria bacterium]|nr:RNA-binding protein [Gammaproteobacteria bacterium]